MMFNFKLEKNDKVRFFMTVFLSLLGTTLLTISVGFSALNQELNVSGDVNYDQARKPLYDVLKKAANVGTYAKKYTGFHHDSFIEEPSKDIYYWWAENNSSGSVILDKNNVIFADHCWQMIRTTDTGGIKLVYNGEPNNNKCLDTRNNHVGYDYRRTNSLSTSYYYGTSYMYDSINKVFSLDGTITKGTIQVGQYTCKNTTPTGTCTTLYYVEKLNSGTTYYVLPLNGSSHYSQFGKLQFNSSDSLAYVGYMYNIKYSMNSKSTVTTENVLSSKLLNTTYWYANSVTWGNPTENRYNLDSPYQVTSTTDYPDLVGKYTFTNTSQTYTNTSVYYIAAVNSSYMYYIQLQNSTNHNLSDYNYTYTYGDSYTDNGNGTYTIDNPTAINRSDWYTNYSNIGAGKYVCKNAVNDTCSDLWYTTSTTNTSIFYIKVANNYKYAKGFTYNSNTNKYTLNNDSVSFYNINDINNITSLNSAHYTCWNVTGVCTNISYILSKTTSTTTGEVSPYYINLSNGKSIEDALNLMLYDNDVNQIDSIIKTGIDAWYKRYMTEYTDRLEDTIFCNDRTIDDFGAWNPDGGSISTSLKFKNYDSNIDLTCTNVTDKFSMANSKAQLTYPVGLLTYPETNLLNSNGIRKTGENYWIGSPSYGLRYFSEKSILINGNYFDEDLNTIIGVRPAVSLKPDTEYTSGTGSKSNPYIVE